ncbi:MAG: dsRBD fold-containing protein [Actinomycetota bacterium]|nr:dsRBD fold-containing protein [Actinomycetota bacterium]
MPQPTWRVEVTFSEHDRATRADAVLDVAGNHHHGWGQARRDPFDRDVPVIGEQVAAARALIRLGHQLLGAAENEIEEIEQHPVRIHA